MAVKFNGLLDYMEWRGDLTFAAAPFNDVDALLLCQISYIPFDNIVPGIGRSARISIEKLSELYFKQEGEHRSSLGVLISDNTIDLLESMAKSPRFKNVRAGFYLNDVNYDEEKQFCAVTFFIGEEIMFVAFRGTDDTVVGWKEDFNMSFMATVPAQKEALEYLENVVAAADALGFNGSIMTGGHSKGGNLSVYSAMMADDKIKERISKIYNFDGPGFDESATASDNYKSVMNRIHTLIPQTSVVGMLLAHEEEYTVVSSRETGLMQHDAFSWNICGPDFITLNRITAASAFIDKSIKKWIAAMDTEQKEKFVTALFSILGSSGKVTLTELTNDKGRMVKEFIKAYKDCDEETKTMLKQTMKLLIDIGKSTFVEICQIALTNN